MARTTPLPPEEETARSYVDRLILRRLIEMESVVKVRELADGLAGEDLGLSAVTSLLASNPRRFAYFDRRWIPATRLEGESRPLAGTVTLLLERLDGPLDLDSLAAEVARTRNRDQEVTRAQVRRLAERDPALLLTKKNEVALSKWGFVAHDETIEKAYAYNGVTADEVAAAAARLGEFDWRAEGALVEAARRLAPISTKLVGAVAWTTLSPQTPHAPLLYDARVALGELLAADDLVYGPDGVLHPAEISRRWVATASRIAENLTPLVELEDVNPIEIAEEDVPRLVQAVVASDGTTTATRLLEDNYEVTPNVKSFPDDLANLVDALKKAPEVVWVGADRFRRAGTLPEGLGDLAEAFRFPTSDAVDEEGELVDVELTDEGLSTSLRKLLQHPLAMDVQDEDPQAQPKQMPDVLRLVLKSIHRELGTFPMCQIPTGFLAPEPKIQELQVTDENGRTLPIYADHDTRLLSGWLDWWFDQPVESGAVFELRRTNRPNVFDFAWQSQPDPVIHIASERMEHLREIGANSEGKSTLDLLIEVMANWPKGADYLTLLAEVNVVRRSTRRLVASLLSSYQCFYQRSGSPVWHYDAKKLADGFDKSKKRFIRKG